MSEDRRMAVAMRRRTHKYNARRTTLTVCGETRTFPSKREAKRWYELKLLEKAGEISGLECQVSYALRVRDVHVCDYVADFVYRTKLGRIVVEDVKSPPTRTPIYRLKRKMLAAEYGLNVSEVM